MFTSTVNRGFHMDFSNGVSISVQWGFSNYCQVRDLKRGYFDALGEETHSSETAEVLIDCKSGILSGEFAKEFNLEDKYDSSGCVLGHLNVEQVADAIQWAKNWSVK